MTRSAYVPPRQAWAQGPEGTSPRMPSPLHLPPRGPDSSNTPPPQPAAAASGAYYEDVDPRFAEPSASRAMPPPAGLDPGNFEDPHQGHQGARSPAISERSTFTSVSQRGVNPRWNPPAPPGGFGLGQNIPRRPVNRNEVNILNSNPDFQLSAARGTGAPPRGGGAYPGL